eukprot:scaffold2957_cov134-Skeletonema_menzelii.AAC.4
MLRAEIEASARARSYIVHRAASAQRSGALGFGWEPLSEIKMRTILFPHLHLRQNENHQQR